MVIDLNKVRPLKQAGLEPEQNPVEAFQAFAGYEIPGIIPDGKLHRFALPGEARGRKSGWYVLHVDGVAAGVAGDWRTGEKVVWMSREKNRLTPGERYKVEQFVREQKEQREREQERVWAQAREQARKVWERARPARGHAYLEGKGVRAVEGLRADGQGHLLVPLVDGQNRIQTLQTITGTGQKRYFPGGKKQGAWFPISGADSAILYICEGLATGLSIHGALDAPVWVAFDTANLLPVARAAREAWPDRQIVLCADNDRFTEGNPGMTKARAAAQAVGAKVVWPEFGEGPDRGTDFNDLAAQAGPQAVRRRILGQHRPRIDLGAWGLENFAGAPPERQWLVQGVIPADAVTVLAAQGDAGKGMLSLDLALKVAARHQATPWEPRPYALGGWVNAHGTAVILTAEDDQGEMHRRLDAMDPDGALRAACGSRLIIVPLPNAGGPACFVSANREGPLATPLYQEVRDQLEALPDLALVVLDPLASFVGADINADPAVGQFTQGLLGSLATQTGAAILIVHHLGKTPKPITGPEQARSLIRGTTAIVDGSRCAMVLWPDRPDRSRRVCQSLNLDWISNRVYRGAVVKSNGPACRQVFTFVRDTNGLLKVRDADLSAITLSPREEKQILLENIAEAASHGRPFTMTGTPGLYNRREELDPMIRALSRSRLEAMAQDLLDARDIGKCIQGQSGVPKWLDVRTGLFAQGRGEFEPGFDYV